jgi:hypothetical protein
MISLTRLIILHFQLKIDHCEEWLRIAETLFPGLDIFIYCSYLFAYCLSAYKKNVNRNSAFFAGRSYLRTMIEFEKISATCAMIQVFIKL